MKLRCVMMAAVVAGAAWAAPTAKPADPDAMRAQLLAKVAEADRELAGAQSAALRSADSARSFFTRAALLVKASRGKGTVDDSAAVPLVARGVTALLAGLDEAELHLAATERSLKEAETVSAPLDAALAGQERLLAGVITAADRDIEAQRKLVQSQWDHYSSPQLAHRAEELRTARVRLEALMSVAAGLWQEREAKRAESKLAAARRRRLAAASRAVKARVVELNDLRQKLGQFRASLLNPLDARQPRASLDKPGDWPAPLRSTMDALDEKAATPKPTATPPYGKLEDRVRRFLAGGTP